MMLLYSMLFLLHSCKHEVVEKPAGLIDEDKMVEIIYDLALLEAIKSQQPVTSQNDFIDQKQYIYKKYKIDSLQFARSNHYYASDISNYKKLYAKVGSRIAEEQKVADQRAGVKGVPAEKIADPDAPQVQ